MFTVIGKVSKVRSEGKNHWLVIAVTDEFNVEVSYYNETAPTLESSVIAQCKPINLDKQIQVLELDAIYLIDVVVSDYGVFATALCRLGAEPELSFTTNQKTLTKVNIAINGNAKDKTLWLKSVSWGKTAETINQYLHKGDQAVFSGEVSRKTWTTKEGEVRVNYELNVKSMNFVGKKQESDNRQPAMSASHTKSASYESPAYVADDGEGIPF